MIALKIRYRKIKRKEDQINMFLLKKRRKERINESIEDRR